MDFVWLPDIFTNVIYSERKYSKGDTDFMYGELDYNKYVGRATVYNPLS